MPPASTRKLAKNKKSSNNWIWIVMYAVIVLAIMLGGAKIALVQYDYERSMDEDTYQAVFLTNGQVYFGRLSSLGFGTMRLQDVYYLQVSGNEEEEAEQQNFSLIRLGDELHGPTSEMIINKRQILFWENLREDSPVIDTIRNGGE